MEFNEKLQELRRQKGLTQEELAEALYVSRTAISKWESGRGYPNVESLKAIAKFFSVTVDRLLSSDELLTIAEEETKQKEKHLCNVVFSLLDCSILTFLFLPLFAQKSDGVIEEVSLLNLSEISTYLSVIYYVFVAITAVLGLLSLAFQNCNSVFWVRLKRGLSLFLNMAGVLLFIVSLQPYAAVLLFVFLAIKVLMIVKKQ